ncbi:uncharacterized protein [Montipora foliosa]|uniref:uncharacterized protein n=1 Tax=Montipora foliosa TaxID=591990 RepID=UPI0035F14A9E
MDLSFMLDVNVEDCTESENPSPTTKRKMDNHDGKAGQAKKKSKGLEKSRSAEASWQASINDEQRRLNLIMEKLPSTKEPLQRSHSPSYDAEVEQHHDLSHILSRLDRIESKLDSILRQSRTPSSTTVSPASSRSETPIPVFTKESKSGTGGAINVASEDDDDGSVDPDFVFNGIDLLALKAPPKEPTRYATKLAGLLFSKEELLQGMVAPVNEKFTRTALDPERITVIRKCIGKRYSEKILTRHWADIRRAINQKCNDIRKKQTTVSVA